MSPWETQIPVPVDHELRLGVSQPRASTAESIKGQAPRHAVSSWLGVQSMSTSLQLWPGQAGAEEPLAFVTE